MESQKTKDEVEIDDEDVIELLESTAQKRLDQKKHDALPNSTEHKQKRPRLYENNSNSARYQNLSRNDRKVPYNEKRPEWKRGSNDNANLCSNSKKSPREKDNANFGLSGALVKDARNGNMYNGVVLKFMEPPEARTPMTKWRLYVFRNGESIETLHISKQSAYLFGREKAVADVLVEHSSLSRQHCVLQYRAVPDKSNREDPNAVRCRPYLMDLGSAHGTFINGMKLEDSRYYELRKKDVITLGKSTREYVLLTENTT